MLCHYETMVVSFVIYKLCVFVDILSCIEVNVSYEIK